jgi:hypothetical protein
LGNNDFRSFLLFRSFHDDREIFDLFFRGDASFRHALDAGYDNGECVLFRDGLKDDLVSIRETLHTCNDELRRDLFDILFFDSRHNEPGRQTGIGIPSLLPLILFFLEGYRGLCAPLVEILVVDLFDSGASRGFLLLFNVLI